MENKTLKMNANDLVAYLQKPAKEFTKADIIEFIGSHNIRMLNFMYPGGDGKLKTLNFVITHQEYLERQQRPLCTAPLLDGFCRSLCRDSHAVHAMLLL